jgi:hypothetical protein
MKERMFRWGATLVDECYYSHTEEVVSKRDMSRSQNDISTVCTVLSLVE